MKKRCIHCKYFPKYEKVKEMSKELNLQDKFWLDMTSSLQVRILFLSREVR